MPLDELKIRLKKMIAEEGIAATLSALKEVLPERSERFEDVLLIESRQNEANRQRLRNLISNEALQITYARIRADLMDLVDQLQPEDFEASEVDEQKVKGKKVKKGSILHRIPDQMQLNEETKCVVRIALDEEVIIRNIDLDEEVVLKSIRVSDIMQVELIDPSDEHPFTIKAISSAEQFVEEDDYTEWIFFVIPLMEGTFPLLLKVAVIELIHGKERKREIVLEENIQILTKAADKTQPSFKDAGYKFAFGSEMPSAASGWELPKTKLPGNLDSMLENWSGVSDRSQPAKILFLAANPSDQSRLQIDREYRILKESLRQGAVRDQFEFLQPQFASIVTEWQRAMNDKPGIIHFSGHGTVEGITVMNDDNQPQLMPLPVLKRLFMQLSGVVEIVILNACYSPEQARVISEFGMYVVGNNLPISDSVAIRFLKSFYNSLGEGKSFEAAFDHAMIVVLMENPSALESIEVWKDGQKLDLRNTLTLY